MAWLVPQRLLSHQIHRDNYTANQQQKEMELKASWQSVYGFLKKKVNGTAKAASTSERTLLLFTSLHRMLMRAFLGRDGGCKQKYSCSFWL